MERTNRRNIPSRFLDAHEESLSGLSIFRYDATRTNVSFEEAGDSLLLSSTIATKLEATVRSLKTTCSNTKLTDNELKAIVFYLMDEPSGSNQSLATKVNRCLQLKSPSLLKSYVPFLQLLISALNKLPMRKGVVWRVTRGNLTKIYEKKITFCWFGFSSCSMSKDILADGMIQNDEYTFFRIECIYGKVVSEFSPDQEFEEILLLPGACFQVTQTRSISDKLHFIDLRQIDESLYSPDSQDEYRTRSSVESTRFHSEPDCGNVRHETCRFKSNKSWTEPTFLHHGQISTIKDILKELKDPDQMVDRSILNRVKGSMFGMAIGDALGAPFEFRPRTYMLAYPVTDMTSGGTWGLDKGQFTDDTSMALCLGISLIARRDFVLYDQLVRYKWWQKYGYMSSTGHCFDIGAATSESLREFERRQASFSAKHKISSKDLDYLSDSRLLAEFDVKCSPADSAGNGALMRLAPVPLFFYRHPERAVAFSGESSIITHNDDQSRDACRYYGALIVAALHGESKEELLDAKFYEKHRHWFGSVPLCQQIVKIAKGSFKNRSGYDGGIRGKGFVVNSIEAALWAFWSDENSFQKGSLKAVNLGDDTDTTAAIYGQLAGAFYGYDALPSCWIKHIFASQMIECVCKWIVYEGARWNPESHGKSKIEPESQTLFHHSRRPTTNDSYMRDDQFRNQNPYSPDSDHQKIQSHRRTPDSIISGPDTIHVSSTPTMHISKSSSNRMHVNSSGTPFANESYRETRDYPDYRPSNPSITSVAHSPITATSTQRDRRTSYVATHYGSPTHSLSRENGYSYAAPLRTNINETSRLVHLSRPSSHSIDAHARTHQVNYIPATGTQYYSYYETYVDPQQISAYEQTSYRMAPKPTIGVTRSYGSPDETLPRAAMFASQNQHRNIYPYQRYSDH